MAGTWQVALVVRAQRCRRRLLCVRKNAKNVVPKSIGAKVLLAMCGKSFSFSMTNAMEKVARRLVLDSNHTSRNRGKRDGKVHELTTARNHLTHPHCCCVLERSPELSLWDLPKMVKLLALRHDRRVVCGMLQHSV